jgi:hypothetical protein
MELLSMKRIGSLAAASFASARPEVMKSLPSSDSFWVTRHGKTKGVIPMVKECWQEMTADEKVDHLREAFREAIDRQDAAIADIEDRVSAIESQTARIGRRVVTKL